MVFLVNQESQENWVHQENLVQQVQPVTEANQDLRVYRALENQEKTVSKGNQEYLDRKDNRAQRDYQEAQDSPGMESPDFQDLKVTKAMPAYQDPRDQKEIRVMEVCQGSLVQQALMEYRAHLV